MGDKQPLLNPEQEEGGQEDEGVTHSTPKKACLPEDDSWAEIRHEWMNEIWF